MTFSEYLALDRQTERQVRVGKVDPARSTPETPDDWRADAMELHARIRTGHAMPDDVKRFLMRGNSAIHAWSAACKRLGGLPL